jgi:uncharacterized protein
MKPSNYNIFFPFEDKMIGYNSISDRFVILDPFLYDLFVASINDSSLHELSNVHENISTILEDNGFIIAKEVNELDKIKQISYKHDFDDKSYTLIINPTMNCNFKCWYCYETHIKDSKMSQETQGKIVKFVDSILLEKKNTLEIFRLDWFGGEPMLYFDKTILPLLKEIHPKMIKNNIQFSSSFTTNGLLITQNILDECKRYGVRFFQITLDGHRERHNKVRYISKNKGSYDKIVQNIKLCLANQSEVSVRINISEETVSDLLKVIDDFKDISDIDRRYLGFSFHEVWQNEQSLNTDISSIIEEFRFNGFICNYTGDNTASINNSCYADKLNQATINYNGEVFKCTARDFESSSKEGELLDDGVIQWNEKQKKRLYESRFTNPPCLDCKILPICNGGCSQHRMEHVGEDYCIHNFDENAKLEVVKQKFLSTISREHLQVI